MVEQVLEGMPDPEVLQLLRAGDDQVVMSGKWVLFRFAAADAGMRKVAMVALTQAPPPPPRSPEPCACCSTNSTPTHPASPATPAPSPTSSNRANPP